MPLRNICGKKEAQLEEKEQVLSEPMILNPEMAE